MVDVAEAPVGQLIRLHRTERGMTTAYVAARAGLSARHLEMIEAGTRAASVPTLRRIARALRVRTSALLNDRPSGDRSEPVGARLTAVERALHWYGSPVGAPAEPPDLPDLAARVDAAWSAWFRSPHKYSDVLDALPGLIGEVEHAVRASDRSPEACRLAASVYRLARPVLKHAGRTDLGVLLADRAMRYAERVGNATLIGAASWDLGHAMLTADMPQGALDVVSRAAERLEPTLADGTAEQFSVYGGLMLCAAVASVRVGDPWHGRRLLRGPAREAAKRVGDGENHHGMVFGPANVAIHAVSVEAEAGEVGAALRLADEVDPAAVPSLERRTTFLYQVAHSHEQQGDDAAVLVHLQAAYRQCPEEFRYHRPARYLVETLVRRARPTFAGEVREFAACVGVAQDQS